MLSNASAVHLNQGHLPHHPSHCPGHSALHAGPRSPPLSWPSLGSYDLVKFRPHSRRSYNFTGSNLHAVFAFEIWVPGVPALEGCPWETLCTTLALLSAVSSLLYSDSSPWKHVSSSTWAPSQSPPVLAQRPGSVPLLPPCALQRDAHRCE